MKTKLLLLLLLANFSIYAQTNLVSNGDFETWTAFSQPTDWFRFSNGLLYQDSDAQKGSSSTKMEITSGTFHYINSSPFATQSGKTYRVTMYHKLFSGTITSVELSLTKADVFKTPITKKEETTSVNSAWQKIEFDYIATTTQNAEISIWVKGTTGTQILVDNVSIVDVADIGPKYTLIPDINFENELIALGVDSGAPDGKVLTSKVYTVTNLYLYRKNIADISGIQDFTSLQRLDASQNLLTNIDVSNNTNLTNLSVNGNKLTNLNISKNTSLTSLSVDSNSLTTLDISKNTKLTNLSFDTNKLTSIDLSFTPLITELSFNYCQITSVDLSNLKLLRRLNIIDCRMPSIDLSNNKSLISLWARDNKFTTLNLSENKELVNLTCDSNLLTALDVSANTKLEYLNFSSNPIANIDLKSNINLKALEIYNTKLSELDLSKNKLLIGLKCHDNSNLKTLNLRNGQNTNLLKSFTYWTGINGSPRESSFKNNSSLSCILVDNVSYSKTNWSTLIDGGEYTLDCATLAYTLIPDSNFEQKLIDLGIDKDGKNGKVLTSSISYLTTLNVTKANITELTGIQDFTALTILNCSENALTTLDLSTNVNLKTLTVSKNQLKSINTSKNIALDYFAGNNNLFTALDFSANTELSKIYITDNVLTSLNVSKNSKLTTLWCQRNKLPTLDISNNLALTEFVCERNELEALNVSKNTALISLSCSQNKIKSLDVSQNTLLKMFDCSINKLESLNLKNGNNKLLDKANLFFFSNLSLKCILVDDVTYSNTNWATSIKDSGASYNIDCTVYTLIPDSNFEDKLIALQIDKDGKNGKVATASIANVTSLDVQSSNIKDLTGIQDFTSLTYLDANYNSISNIDVSNNKLLIKLALHENKLTSLNVTKNVNLYNLMFSKNQISTIDLSQNKALVHLTADRNLLSSLNISANTKLESLYCGDNNLTALDVSHQPNLLQLNCTFTSISQIDVSTNKKLENLYFDNAQLTTLDVSNNTLLKRINVSNNLLKSLDLSHNPILELVLIRFNPITTLNLQNGNNENFILPPTSGTNKTAAVIDACNFLNNKNLSCIQVDNVEFSNANWSAIKDATANYNLDCRSYTLIPDAAFEDKLIALQIDKDGKNGKVLTSSIAVVTTLDVSSSSIKDLTGIQDFVSLKVLNCSTNQLTSLTPANNLSLTELNVSYNALTTLDVSKNKALTALNVSNNNLNSLNVKNGFNTNMDWFSVNFTKNASLSCIQVDNAKYSNDNWNGKLDKTSYFTEDCNAFTLIPDSNFEDELIALKIDIDGKNGKVLTSTISTVKDLNVQLSDIKDLTGIQDFTSLEYLNCQFNLLTSLNVSKNSKLIELYTHGNDLTTLDVSANTALTTLYANKNKLTALDLSKNTKLVYVNVAENSLKTLNLKNGNNSNFTGALLNKNTSLTCITVDNPSFAASSGVFFKDTAATYSATCTLGLEDSVFSKATLYPNPTKGEVNINNVSLEKATVYNSLGQLVKTFVLNNGETSNTINLSGLPRGVYFVYLISGDAASAKKIIVE
ncbi:T9SS type A sorting domain-containing protein [Flavobacterium chungbukense]|uniref:Secretion system C-terminal sorting domain-containing protein n=1 Tax=Flavobacterium chungbukense TaxID=877464 RepID=A0ABP7XYF3_9FLAO|nr:T9SS type A sorting domain-containing protein [Flavobacterium chungbukense]MCC4921870.1 T9SS type A sorting domain-containing protein [Flavobacterium chungbukense]